MEPSVSTMEHVFHILVVKTAIFAFCANFWCKSPWEAHIEIKDCDREAEWSDTHLTD